MIDIMHAALMQGLTEARRRGSRTEPSAGAGEAPVASRQGPGAGRSGLAFLRRVVLGAGPGAAAIAARSTDGG
jgi:hypothetical protein